jgi:hypothetical protein
MGFANKLIKKTAASTPRTATGNTSTGEPREYYPKSIGIYCEDNPKVERRGIRPYIIGSKPPTHKTVNIEFKGNVFPSTAVYYGKLFAEPIIINMGYYPANSLYPGKEERIFPNTSNDFDKKIPLVPDMGVDYPLSYDLLSPVPNERKRLTEILSKNLSDKGRAKVEQALANLASMKDDEKIRTTHEVKIIPKVFIPVLMTIVTEDTDEEGELVTNYDPKLVLFEETMGIKKAKTMVTNNLISSADDVEGMLDYLYGDIGDATAVGQPIVLFRNQLAAEGRDSIPPLAAKLFEDKIPKALLPFFDIKVAPTLDEAALLRLVVLEMIGLYAPKGDTTTIEGKLKEAFWAQIQTEGK